MEQLSIQIGSMEDVMKGIDAAQRKACTAFIEIGYILRKADDGQLYKEKGYTSIFTFAEHEYGWDKSRTSRYMAVNKEYSEGGYSCVLKERYGGYGQAKLEEMLKLPGEIREEITPETKRDDIRQIGKEYKMAEEARQEEQFKESFAPAQQNSESIFPQAVRTLFEQEEYAKRIPDLWPYVLHHKEGETVNEQDLLMALTPSGFGHARAGSFMVFFRKDEIAVLRGREKETRNWTDFLDTIIDLSQNTRADTPEDWYREVFGKELPKEDPPEPEKSVTNNETSISDTNLQTKEKEHKKEEKTAKKEAKKSPSATGGTPEKPESEKNFTEAAVKIEENNETSVLDRPLEGQTEIGEFIEKMPVGGGKPSGKEERAGENTEECITEAAVKTGENDETSVSENDTRPEDDLISRSVLIGRLKEMYRGHGAGTIWTTYVSYGDVINEVASQPAAVKEETE